MIELPVDEPTNVSVKSVGLLYLWESLVDLNTRYEGVITLCDIG